MTTFQKLDKALRARGWPYDVGDEVFRDSGGKLIRSTSKDGRAKVKSMQGLGIAVSQHHISYQHSPK